ALSARNTSILGFQPASRAVTSSEAPSATNRPVSRRALRMWSERISLTRSFCRLVMMRAPPRTPSEGDLIARPAGVKRGRQQPTGRLLDHGQFAALDGTSAAGQALAHQTAHGKRRGADGIGGE